MNAAFHQGNRQRLYAGMKDHSLLILFSGTEVRKTNDEFYPFFAERSFLYLTGLTAHSMALVACKDTGNSVRETLYLLPPDPMAEHWTGTRVSPKEAQEKSGIANVAFTGAFEADLHRLASTGNWEYVYLDLYRCTPQDRDAPSHRLLERLRREYPFLKVENANRLLRRLRTIKQPCELEAMRQAEKITCEGITNMMKGSRPGLYEYQYKAIFDYTLGQYGPQGPGFPSIISAGRNNFCIHYYSYTGQALDGDMVLNDVGAQFDGYVTDVSRGWPCNGRYSEKQRLLYDCALKTSDHMFSLLRPGYAMAEVDRESHRFCGSLLREIGALKPEEDVSKLMWHGGAHHVGLDVHDVVETPELVAPGMVFCVDIGIYHEEWGIGFRVEDNCLITENGCENLSACTPRTPEEIEDVMARGSVGFVLK